MLFSEIHFFFYRFRSVICSLMSTIPVYLPFWRRSLWSNSIIYPLSSQLCCITRPSSSNSSTTAQAKSKQQQLIQVNSTAHHCMQIVKYDCSPCFLPRNSNHTNVNLCVTESMTMRTTWPRCSLHQTTFVGLLLPFAPSTSSWRRFVISQRQTPLPR